MDGSTITDTELSDINLQVTMGTSEIPANLVDAVAGDNPVVELSLAHDGDFGFDAVLSLQIEEGLPGQYGNLYYYNPKTEEMEFLCASKIDDSQTLSFVFKHASDYAIVITDEPLQDVTAVQSTGQDTDHQVVEAMAAGATLGQSVQQPARVLVVVMVILGISIVLGILICVLVGRGNRMGRSEDDDSEED